MPAERLSILDAVSLERINCLKPFDNLPFSRVW